LLDEAHLPGNSAELRKNLIIVGGFPEPPPKQVFDPRFRIEALILVNFYR
jgi:hypothetical protein